MQNETKKIKRGDRLQASLFELAVGETLAIPYRCFSENTIRSTLSQLKLSHPMRYEVNTKSNSTAIVTRTE